MSNPDPIRDYLSELSQRFPAGGPPSQRILIEIEDHLRQSADRLRTGGMDRRDAERAAIASFGAADQIASHFAEQAPLPCEEEIMIRFSLTALVAITALYAAMLAGFAIFNGPTSVLTYVITACGAIVVGFGVLVVRWQWAARPLKVFERFALFCGGLCLIEIGTANAVWTAHLGLVTGDWEFYGFVGGMLIALLGTLAAIWIAFPGFPGTAEHSHLPHVAR